MNVSHFGVAGVPGCETFVSGGSNLTNVLHFCVAGVPECETFVSQGRTLMNVSHFCVAGVPECERFSNFEALGAENTIHSQILELGARSPGGTECRFSGVLGGCRTFSYVLGGIRGTPPYTPSEKEEQRTSHANEPRWGRRM